MEDSGVHGSSEPSRPIRSKVFPLLYDQFEVEVPRKRYRAITVTDHNPQQSTTTEMPITNPAQHVVSLEDMQAIAWAYEEDAFVPSPPRTVGRKRALPRLFPATSSSSSTTPTSSSATTASSSSYVQSPTPEPQARSSSCCSINSNLGVIVIDDSEDDDDDEISNDVCGCRVCGRQREADNDKSVDMKLFLSELGPSSLSVFRAQVEDNRAHIKILADRKSRVERIESDFGNKHRRFERYLGKVEKEKVKANAKSKERKTRFVRESTTSQTITLSDETLITSFDDEPIKIEEVPTEAAVPPPPNASTRPASYPCKVRIWPVRGKGLGLIATMNIEQGALIVSETPFLEVDSPFCEMQIAGKVRNLSTSDRLLFESFTADPTIDGTDPTDRLVSIVARNVVPMGGDPKVELSDEIIPLDKDQEMEQSIRCGIFEYICRANHSCVPNSRWTWNVTTKRLDLKALVSIKSGEEVTACYPQDPALSFAKRQAAIHELWSFTCTCRKCSLLIAERNESDVRLRQYRSIRDRYIGADNEDTWKIVGFKETWVKIGQAIDLLVQEDLRSEVVNCWLSRFEASVRWGNEARALEAGKQWLKEVMKIGDVVSRDDMVTVKQVCKRIGWRAFEAEEPESGDDSGEEYTTRWASRGTRGKRRSSTSAGSARSPLVTNPYQARKAVAETGRRRSARHTVIVGMEE